MLQLIDDFLYRFDEGWNGLKLFHVQISIAN